MKKLLIVLIPCVLTTGCAPALISAAAVSRGRHGNYAIHQVPREVSPVGRWDNVMMLEPGTPVKVLTMDGTVVTGRFVAANIATVRLETGTAASFAMVDVMRVDRLGTAHGTVATEGLKGAAVGAGAAGVAGLLLGVTPPPRVFAGAAAIGAYQGANISASTPGPRTIYLAAAAAPVSETSPPVAAVVRK